MVKINKDTKYTILIITSVISLFISPILSLSLLFLFFIFLLYTNRELLFGNKYKKYKQKTEIEILRPKVYKEEEPVNIGYNRFGKYVPKKYINYLIEEEL